MGVSHQSPSHADGCLLLRRSPGSPTVFAAPSAPRPRQDFSVPAQGTQIPGQPAITSSSRFRWLMEEKLAKRRRWSPGSSLRPGTSSALGFPRPAESECSPVLSQPKPQPSSGGHRDLAQLRAQLLF